MDTSAVNKLDLSLDSNRSEYFERIDECFGMGMTTKLGEFSGTIFQLGRLYDLCDLGRRISKDLLQY